MTTLNNYAHEIEKVEYRITNEQNRRDWEEFVGCKLTGSVVYLTKACEFDNMHVITAIQMSAAMRRKR